MSAPAAPDVLLTDRTGIERVLSQAGVDARVNVSRTTVVSDAEEAEVTHVAAYASDLVQNLVGNRYAAADLATSYLVYTWASVIAAYELCLYQAGFVPQALLSEYEQVLDRLQKVGAGQDRLASIPSSQGAGVAMDNLRLDPRFRYKQLRRERTISDGPSRQASPAIEDITNLYLFERNA